VSATADIQPSPGVQVAIGVSIGDNTDHTQWYANVADSTNRLHYLFARLHQRTAAVTVRGSVAMSRDLMLEVQRVRTPSGQHVPGQGRILGRPLIRPLQEGDPAS